MGSKSTNWPASDKAKQFVKDQIAIDSLSAPVDMGWPYEEIWEEYHGRAYDAGITSIGVSVVFSDNGFEEACALMSRHLRHINADPDKYTVVRTTGDIRRAHEAGKHSVFFNAQGCECLENKPDFYMPLLKNMGVGTMFLAYNDRYRAGDGQYVAPELRLPVSAYGKKVIDACHKNRVVFDTTHSCDETAFSAIEYSQKVAPDKPVIESHTGPDAFYDNPLETGRLRTISDERMQAIADTGGVIALTLLPWLIISPSAAQVTPEDAVDRIDHMKKVVGIDHIALSSDDMYDWRATWDIGKELIKTLGGIPWADDGGLVEIMTETGSEDTGEPALIYPGITDEMWKRGYSDEDVSKVLGGNLMRVYEQVWG